MIVDWIEHQMLLESDHEGNQIPKIKILFKNESGATEELIYTYAQLQYFIAQLELVISN